MQKTIKICTTCKGHFVAQGRSVMCLPCWKADRGYEATKADRAHMELSQAFGELNDEANRLQVQVVALRAQLDLAKVKANASPISSTSSTGLDAKLLRKILVLCHPDKHGNSESATEVTKILLQMRGKK